MPRPHRACPRQLHNHQAYGSQPDPEGARQGLAARPAQGRRLGRRFPRKPHYRMNFFTRFPWAEDGKELAPNTVYLLPGGRNGELLRVRPGVFALRLLEEGGALYRPNADILFRSAALSARRPVGVILTGRGSDGTEGARALAQRGCPVLVQDPVTAVIWGMPRSAIDAGLATEVLDVAGLGQRLAAMGGQPG